MVPPNQQKRPPTAVFFAMILLSFLHTSIELPNQFHAPINTKGTAIEGQVVVLCVAPLHIRIKPVVGRPAFVLLAQPLLRGNLPFTVYLHDSFRPELQIRVNKHPQAIGLVPENIVRAPAHNDTGALFRQFRNDPALDLPNIVFVAGAKNAM